VPRTPPAAGTAALSGRARAIPEQLQDAAEGQEHFPHLLLLAPPYRAASRRVFSQSRPFFFSRAPPSNRSQTRKRHPLSLSPAVHHE